MRFFLTSWTQFSVLCLGFSETRLRASSYWMWNFSSSNRRLRFIRKLYIGTFQKLGKQIFTSYHFLKVTSWFASSDSCFFLFAESFSLRMIDIYKFNSVEQFDMMHLSGEEGCPGDNKSFCISISTMIWLFPFYQIFESLGIWNDH